MIAALNLLPVLILFCGLYWGYLGWKKSKTVKPVVIRVFCTLILLHLYFQVQPSYMPKGEVKRTAIPTFEQKEVSVKDVQPKPMSGEERDQRRKELYEEPLPFIEKEVDNK